MARSAGRLSSQRPLLLVELIARVVTRRQPLSADLARGNQQLVELQMVVAQAARDRRAPGEILLHERPHYVVLEAIFLVDDIIRDAERLGDAPRVVHIVK